MHSDVYLCTMKGIYLCDLMHSGGFFIIAQWRAFICVMWCISLHSGGIYLCDGQFEGTAHQCTWLQIAPSQDLRILVMVASPKRFLTVTVIWRDTHRWLLIERVTKTTPHKIQIKIQIYKYSHKVLQKSKKSKSIEMICWWIACDSHVDQDNMKNK